MKRVISALIISIAVLFGKDSQSFISAGVIHENIDNYENTQALHLCYSYMNFNRFGFDTGYAQSFFKSKNREGDEKNFSSIYLFPTYLIPLNSYMAFKAKAGYSLNQSSTDSLGYGADIIFQVNRRSGFSFGFQKMNRKINYFMVDTIYKF